MDKFTNKINEIAEKYNKIAMFIDMDGTVVEYKLYTEEEFKKQCGNFINGEPLKIVIDKLRKINEIPNIDLYILSLSKNTKIVEEKEIWLSNNMDFIKKENYIILNKENGQYDKDNRDVIKTNIMKDKLNEYDHFIFLDDDHKILRIANDTLKENINVYHISSALI